jgi:SOS-response transcriptional repressor LexA
MSNLSERLYRVLKNHPTLRKKDLLAAHLGCSRSMLYHYEQGSPPPPPELMRKLVALEVALGFVDSTVGESTHDEIGQVGSERSRRIPVLGMAHAGMATSYEEISFDHQSTIPTDCPDPKAFGVNVVGDSMWPIIDDGHVLVLMPSYQIYSGCVAVCRFRDDAILVRRVEIMPDHLRLVPDNVPRYEATSHKREEIAWIYPVWGAWNQLWKGKA